MSRIAKQPIDIPKGVELKLTGQRVEAKGPFGALSHALHTRVSVAQEGDQLVVSPLSEDQQAWAMAGTTRSVIDNLVQGVHAGWEKSLDLVGVGYRAQVKGKVLGLTLGFSHPVDVVIPDDLEVETPSQTRILVKGADKRKVGQFAADIRAIRPPEPYKGKGVRFTDETVVRKQAKKA